MEQKNPLSLEERTRTPRKVEIVSNMNDLRTGQLMDQIERANRTLNFLSKRRQIVLVERNHDYLDEILTKVLPELCPKHLLSYQNHHLPHYIVRDGKVEIYQNLEPASPVILVKARVKHPCSVAEKVPRKAVYFGRVSERHDNYKLMVGDVLGLEVVVRDSADVDMVVKQILQMPFFKLEHYERHRKNNGYSSDHLNTKYENGNAVMKGLEVEIQVTTLNSHRNSIYNPNQGHDTSYGAEKLGSRHHLGDRQLVIVGNSVDVPEDMCFVKRTDGLLVANVPNPVQKYLLIVPQKH
ncbi:RelA/SpoT domain-containing protein [Candidatus Woesearchaeota archaeon]|nr:RelA/SpoT domain-containing protein [Candidatus Woesearchaeota archaeon]